MSRQTQCQTLTPLCHTTATPHHTNATSRHTKSHATPCHPKPRPRRTQRSESPAAPRDRPNLVPSHPRGCTSHGRSPSPPAASPPGSRAAAPPYTNPAHETAARRTNGPVSTTCHCPCPLARSQPSVAPNLLAAPANIRPRLLEQLGLSQTHPSDVLHQLEDILCQEVWHRQRTPAIALSRTRPSRKTRISSP
jgi:hypothetical protein